MMSRPIGVNPSSSKHPRAPIMKNYYRSRRLLILMMYLGVTIVLGMRVGKRLEIVHVEFNGVGRDSDGQEVHR